MAVSDGSRDTREVGEAMSTVNIGMLFATLTVYQSIRFIGPTSRQLIG